MNLPSILNLNPQSIMNKVENFKTYMIENEIDVAFISESWERPNEPLSGVINLENYSVISNPHQRRGQGGRPAIVINNLNFDVEDLTQSVVSVPFGCEIVWGLITLKNATNLSLVKKIVLASVYVKPLSRKGKLLHDHIAETYHMLCAKYGDPLDFILAGDVNTWKVEPVLHLNSSFRQLVTQPTRHNPDAVLDVVLTTLGKYYQTPVRRSSGG